MQSLTILSMSPNVDEVITKMSACELESVKYANSWKFIDDEDYPHPIDEEAFKCKKDICQQHNHSFLDTLD